MISVAICTFNRAGSLRRTLESLASVAPPQVGGWELLVVDNNSSDSTRAVVAEFESALPVRYVFEAEQGLSLARNRAIREFRADLLLFT
ncbi:MAG: glycosyltransferase family 2 protein, partial [Aeromicrobium sp.]|nr:glycosyltransferase family 2 protein [Burkholderiales bacterium]